MQRDSCRQVGAKGTACRAPTDDGTRSAPRTAPLRHPGSATCWRAPTVDRYKHNQIRPPEGGRYRGNCLVAGAVVVELAAGGHCCERVAAGAELLVEGIVIYFIGRHVGEIFAGGDDLIAPGLHHVERVLE